MAQGARRALHGYSADRYRMALAERLYLAFEEYNRATPRSGKLTQADLGRLVAEKLGRPKPFTQANVSSWMSETEPSQPDNETIRALAELLNVDVMWLLYGAAED